MSEETVDITIIGAGPVGLAAARPSRGGCRRPRSIRRVACDAVLLQLGFVPEFSTNTGVPGVVAGQV